MSLPEPLRPFELESADQAPRVRPLTYPGRWPAGSALMLDDAEWPISEIRGARVGRFTVDRTEPAAESARACSTLDEVLDELDAAPVDARTPVLAIGSNAAGSQLRHKAAAERFPLGIPMLRAEVTGVTTTYATYVSSLGYVPATLAWTPGVRSSIFVQLLDDRQVAALDATETGYARVELLPDEVDVVLGSGERLGGVHAYVATGGYLAQDGAPIPLGDQATILDLVRTSAPDIRGTEQLAGRTDFMAGATDELSRPAESLGS